MALRTLRFTLLGLAYVLTLAVRAEIICLSILMDGDAHGLCLKVLGRGICAMWHRRVRRGDHAMRSCKDIRPNSF